VITLHSSQPGVVAQTIVDKFGLKPEALDGVVRLQRERGHEFVPQLIEAMPGLIDSVSVGKPTLEDVFIEATGHIFRDDPSPD
jgi:ABC-2 type transport system ATP-binding protein